MSVRDLIPWGRSNHQVPTAFRDDDRNPFLSLHREMNRLFDDVFRGFASVRLAVLFQWPGRMSRSPTVRRRLR